MATDYTSTINGYYQAVQFQNGPVADVTVYNAALNSGTLTTAQVQAAIINDSITTTIVDVVIREYQAAFNRVPDQAGLKYWVNAIEANPAMLTSLNTIFANSTEFNTRFGATATTTANTALVTALYTNVYGRAPDAAGLAYWAGSGLTAAQLLQAFSNAQEFVTMTSAAVNAYLQLEIAGTPVTTGSLFAVAGPSTPGSSFALTTATDILNGTSGNDTFIGDQSNAATPQVSIADTINGGLGIDTFNEFVGGQAFVLPTLNSVEVVNVIGSTIAQAINTTTASGVTNVNIKNDTTGGDAITVGSGTAVGFDNVKTGAGVQETVNFAAAATTGAINLYNGTSLDTTGAAGGLTVTGAALTSLSINSTGAANTIATLTTPNNVTSLTMTGDQKETITNALNANILTVNASADTGGISVKLGAVVANKTVTVTGGSGNDTVDVSSVTNGDNLQVNLGAGNDTLKVGAGVLTTFTSGTVLDGGPGTDVMNVAAGADLTATTAAMIKNFEVLDVSGGAGTYDTSVIAGTGITTYQADHAIGGAFGAVTFSNVASTGFVFSDIGAKGAAVAADTQLQLSLKTAASGTDAATINLVAVDGNNNGAAGGNVTLTTLDASNNGGIENLTINSSVNGIDTGLKATSYTNTITTLQDFASAAVGDHGLTTLTITGNANLAVTNQLGNLTSADLVKVDASASTGNITLDVGIAAKGITYLGSAGVDTVIFGNAGASIYGAAGDDAFNLGAGHTTADTLVYKAGTDTTQTLDASGTKIATGSALETITNFQSVADGVASHDTIDLTNLAFSGVAKGIAQLGTIATVNGGTFASTSSTLFTDAGGVRGVAVGNDGTNTFVFIDANHDGVFNASQDLVVKLAGVHTVSSADFAF